MIHLYDKTSVSTRGALLGEARSVDEGQFCVSHAENGEHSLGRGEALARQTDTDIHWARRYPSYAKVWRYAGDARLANELPLHIHEYLAHGKPYLTKRATGQQGNRAARGHTRERGEDLTRGRRSVRGSKSGIRWGKEVQSHFTITHTSPQSTRTMEMKALFSRIARHHQPASLRVSVGV